MRVPSFHVLVPVLTILSLAPGSAVFAQDAGLALSTSVGYRTQRASLNLTPEQAKQADDLSREATEATQAGKYGDALNDYAHGMAVMHNVEWTPEVEFASALRGKLDHAMLDNTMSGSAKVSVTLAPLYPTERAAQAKLSAEVFIAQGGGRGGASNAQAKSIAPKMPVDPSKPFTELISVPTTMCANCAIEVRLTDSHGSAPTGLGNVYTKVLAIHIETLSDKVKHLRDSLAEVSKTHGSPALATANYALELYTRADRGETNPRAYDFQKEFASAQAIVDAVGAGRNPYTGLHGDYRRAYLSTVDNTLQPYRLFIPDAYDGSKPAPLVVALHGMGGDENSMFDSYGRELTPDANKYGFLVVAPKGRDQASMYRGSAEKDVMDVLAEVERDYKVDRDRIYLMGHSMGGYGTWSVAMDYPDVWAALGPISGGGSTAGLEKIRSIPEYVTHGDNDKTVNVNSSRTMVAAGKKLGMTIVYNEVPGGSHVSVAQPAFAPMMEFFSKQSKSGRMSASR